jgi:hypothetical protein
MRLVLHPLREPPHPWMVPECFNRVVTSLKLRVADRDVDVSVARAAQGDRLAWAASLEHLPTLPSTLHLPGARAWQEVVASETVRPDGPGA